MICAIIAGIISFQMPKVYRVTMAIEPGIAGIKDGGGFTYIDSVENISGKIDEGIYNKRIKEELQLDPLKTIIGFKSEIVKKTSLIKITSQWQEGETDLGLKASKQLIALISRPLNFPASG